jgi:predicted  nucleic acid-binding Zn-ribbon protein
VNRELKMLKEIEQLLIVQSRDQKIKTMRAELGTIPFERTRIEQFLAAKTKTLEELKLRGRETEMNRKKLELDAESRRDTIAKFKTQQFQTRKNEEFQAIGNEIKRFENEIQSIEDREIELMEQTEAIQSEIANADREFKAAKVHAEQQRSDLERKKTILEEQLQTITKERDASIAGISPDLLYRYDRLFASKDGNAVVPIEHEFCMGCHMKNTTTLVHRVKLSRDIINCEQCGRILYWPTN